MRKGRQVKSDMRLGLLLGGLLSVCLAGSQPLPGSAETLTVGTGQSNIGSNSPRQAAQIKKRLSSQGGAFLMGDQVRQSVDRAVSDLKWSTNLGQCQWEAQHSGKLVFWMHMLGSINGFT